MENENKTGHAEVSLLSISHFLSRCRKITKHPKNEAPELQLFRTTPLLNKTAFTLIELLVVVLIIGILAAVAVPQYERAVMRTRCTEAILMLRAITDAQERYALANNEYTNDLSELDIGVQNSNYFTYSCKQKRTCNANPKKAGYPSFEFHMQQKLSEQAREEYLGKHWCIADITNTTQTNLCKTLGTLEDMGSGDAKYYVINK